MKKILTLIAAIGIASTVQAQTDVYFKINHKLGSAPFAFNTLASNNLDDEFQLTRLDYYISEITLTYDGGQDTTLSDLYLLVSAGQPVNEFLGSFNITNLQSIQFGIGVDQSANHLDPTTYPFGHPLALHTPTMHWGWTAGYRFVAIEGLTGQSMNQAWQLHALGDKNYGYATVATTGAQNGNDLIIALDADYEKALKDINITASLNYHGEDGDAATLFPNFHSEVFTAGSASVGLEEVEDEPVFTMAPNPTHSTTTIHVNESLESGSQVMVMDMTGRVISRQPISSGEKMEISLPLSGMYIINLEKNGQLLQSRKLIVE